LYGELSFEQEEELERHLGGCAFCRHALSREQLWHSTLKGEQKDVPLDLLAECRQELKSAIACNTGQRSAKLFFADWRNWLPLSPTKWSAQVALGSFLVFVGFTVGRYVDRIGFTRPVGSPANEMSLVGPSSARIRDIRTGSDNQVRIILDRVQEQEVTGRPDDDYVRQLLLAAMSDPRDPGLRVDSVEILKGQARPDVRDALIRSAATDDNAAVRIKALQALRPFADDPATQSALKVVLERDEDPSVRSEAINVLAAGDQDVDLRPDIASTLQQILHSDRSDDYVRARCMQLLAQMQSAGDVY
jgi:hypothetical protein